MDNLSTFLFECQELIYHVCSMPVGLSYYNTDAEVKTIDVISIHVDDFDLLS